MPASKKHVARTCCPGQSCRSIRLVQIEKRKQFNQAYVASIAKDLVGRGQGEEGKEEGEDKEKNFIVTTGGGFCPDEIILSANNILLPSRTCFPWVIKIGRAHV